jgi:hypothetical protein
MVHELMQQVHGSDMQARSRVLRYHHVELARSLLVQTPQTWLRSLREYVTAGKKVMVPFRTKRGMATAMRTVILPDGRPACWTDGRLDEEGMEEGADDGDEGDEDQLPPNLVWHPDVLWFDGDSTSQDMAKFEDIDRFISDAKIVCFTSKVTVGADFQTLFEVIFLNCEGRSGPSARDIFQMIGRARNVTDSRIRVCLPTNTSGLHGPDVRCRTGGPAQARWRPEAIRSSPVLQSPPRYQLRR